MGPTIINAEERFPHFPNAPIVECVIDIRPMTPLALDEACIREVGEQRLEGYSYRDTQKEFRTEFQFQADNPPERNTQSFSLKGLRFWDENQKQTVQLNKDGYVFSRLAPYSNWTDFIEEGMKHWETYAEIAKTEEIKRAGLRYINRIQLPVGETNFEDYLHQAPAPPNGLDLPFFGYMHHDTLAVTGHNYAINLIKTIQPPKPDEGIGLGLILDIDVFTPKAFAFDHEHIIQSLNEMRWLKNKAFFGSITPKSQELFR